MILVFMLTMLALDQSSSKLRLLSMVNGECLFYTIVS